jgi:uncharacterized protein (TIGR03663 family)
VERSSLSPGSSSVRDGIIASAILLTALPFYFLSLSLKPPHADEGANGFFVNQIWRNGFFTYDPANYHGPLLFYLFQISEKVFGFGVYSFRIVTASFSLFTIWLILKARDTLGRYSSAFIALALAVSPGAIFFGRSAIHEPVFVFFQVLWMVGFLKLRERSDRQGILWFSLGLLGCTLLKETFVILGLAFVLSWGWIEISPRIPALINTKLERPRRVSSDLDENFFLGTYFVAVLIWFSLFTGFFHHLKGTKDFFVALVPWLKTGAAGAGHEKPYYYWLELMRRYEWIALAGVALALPGLISRLWKLRFFSALALINGFIYSVIPYKTPWCIISIMWPFFVVAGLYVESVLDKARPKSALVLSLFAGAVVAVVGHSMSEAYRLNFVNYADPSEPYVYVQTKDDLKVVEDIIARKIRTSPEYQNIVVQVNLRECWPLPWLFSRLPNAAFGDEHGAFDLRADIIFTEVNRSGQDLGDLYLRRKIELRDAREPVYVYLKKSSFGGMDLPGFGTVGSLSGVGGS